MELTVEHLKKIRFFESYNEKQLQTFIAISSVIEFKVRDIIFEQYSELHDVYILLSGCLSLGISFAGEKRMHLGSLEEGELFSWSAVFKPYISTAWVMATCPSRVLAIDAEKLNNAFQSDCEFGFKTMTKIAQTISRRLSDTRFQLINQLTI